ncbi:MAG: hypothetical protein WBX11_16000 [Thiobacillaceae bacterium]
MRGRSTAQGKSLNLDGFVANFYVIAASSTGVGPVENFRKILANDTRTIR